MHLQQSDLEGTHYHWADNGQHIFTGQPTRRTFDRYNGDQVLFLINFYGSLSDGFTLDEARKVERKLFNELPLESKSEISVFNWIGSEFASANESR